jgi:hypothetical protein
MRRLLDRAIEIGAGIIVVLFFYGVWVLILADLID